MTSATQAEPPLGIPAATVVIFRNGENDAPPEILMQIRSRTMAFAGGMAVFPGGRVDDADFELAEKWIAKRELAMPVHEAAHRIAAIRETLEEAGLALGMTGAITDQTAEAGREMLDKDNTLAPVLEKFGWQLDLDAIIPFARWFPKNENISRVYDTRFYLADMGTGDVTISADNSETTRLFWVTAQGALKMAEKGEIKLIFPTRRNLERLALFSSFEEARAQAEAIPVKTIIPQIDESGDQPMLRIMEDAGYPITAEFLDTVMRG